MWGQSVPAARVDAHVTLCTRRMLHAVQGQLHRAHPGTCVTGRAQGRHGREPGSFAEALLELVLPYVVDDPISSSPGPVFGIRIGCKVRCVYPCVALDGTRECCTVLGLDEPDAPDIEDRWCVVVPLCLTFQQQCDACIARQAPFVMCVLCVHALRAHAGVECHDSNLDAA